MCLRLSYAAARFYALVPLVAALSGKCHELGTTFVALSSVVLPACICWHVQKDENARIPLG